MKLNQILCSNCQGAGLELQPDGAAACRFCGTPNEMPGPICPNCEEVNRVGAESCSACRATLVRRCPDCSTANWSGAAHCVQCGRSLDLLDYVSAKWQRTVHEELQAEAHKIKTLEEAASQQRLAQMNATEERRQRALQEAMARQAVRQRQQFTFVAIGVAIFAVVVVFGLIAALLAR